MTREEVLDLLPLYAGGDLDEVTTASVRAALAADPSLAQEARAWEDLDGLLDRALAPTAGARSADAASVPSSAALAEDAAPAPAAPRVTVRRRCPFCHDALQATSIALCASCATPHHAACFAQNHGCSLLGCGGTRAVAADGPESVVCEGCERHTPAGAPFCAWCGAGLGEGQRPLHERAERTPSWTARRYAAAAALLLGATFGMGGFFGLQQRQVLGGLARVGEQLEAQRAEGLMPQVLEVVNTAQQHYRVNDLDGDGDRDDFVAAYAPLVEAIRGTRFADFDLLRWPGAWERHYAIEVHRSADGDRYCALAVPRDPGSRLELWFVSDEGRVAVIPSRDEVDLAACRLVPVPEILPEPVPVLAPPEAGRAEPEDTEADQALRGFIAALDAGQLDEAERQLRRVLEPPPTPERALRYRNEVGYERWVRIFSEDRGGLAEAAERLLERAHEAFRPSTEERLEARVLAIKRDTRPPLVLVSRGTDHGVQRGSTLSILRGERRIATVVVERSLRDSAGCRVVFTAAGEEIQEGDRVIREPASTPGGAGEPDQEGF